MKRQEAGLSYTHPCRQPCELPQAFIAQAASSETLAVSQILAFKFYHSYS